MFPRPAIVYQINSKYWQRFILSGKIGRELDAMPIDEVLLAKKYRERLLYFGLRRLRDRNAAEGLAQEVILRVIQATREGRLRDESKLGSFVFGVAANLLKEKFREKSQRQSYENSQADPADQPWLADVQADAFLEEQIAQVRRALAQLDSKDKELLTRCFYDAVPLPELADKMGISYSALRKRKSRALKRLKSILSDPAGVTEAAQASLTRGEQRQS